MQTLKEASSRQLTTELNPIFQLLKLTYGVVPIVAGADKFLNLLTDWEQYLHPAMVQLLPFSAHVFMMIVGIIEISAGILVLKKPAIGGLVVAAWLTSIALSLIAGGHFIDVAVRDLVMAVGAFSLTLVARLTELSK